MVLEDKSFGLIRIRSPVGANGIPSIEIFKKPVPRHEKFGFDTALVKTEARLTGRQDSLLKNGKETMVSFVIKLDEGDAEKTLAIVDVLDSELSIEGDSTTEIALSVFDLYTDRKLNFGEVITRVKKDALGYIITSVLVD